MKRNGSGWLNTFLILILSFIPGCGHMYMGLMKRGGFILFSFFACSYLAASIFFRVFSVGFINIWLFGFFDAYNCKKKIDSGKEVLDNVDDIKRFLMKYRKIIMAVFGIVAVIEISRGSSFINEVNSVAGNGGDYTRGIIFDNILIFLLICIGLYCLFFRKK